MCLFRLRIFEVLLQASHRPPTLSRTFIAGSICLTKNKIWVFHPWGGIWVFHPWGGGGGGGGGICPILLHPNTRELLLLLFYPTASLNFGRCPISELTTHLPRMVKNSTMHTHPTRRDVTVHMKCMMSMHFPSCYMYICILHETLIHHGKL